jgi:hypothetical protein
LADRPSGLSLTPPKETKKELLRGLQEGVLSPLLWSLVVDELLWELNDIDYYTVG